VLSLGSISLGGFGIGRKTIATLLSVVMFGAGHIFLGETKRGIAIVVMGIGLSLISYPGFLGIQNVTGASLQAISVTAMVSIGLFAVGLGSIGFWIWQILDSRKIATRQQSIEA
jgi:hypothetical protein